MDYALPAAPGNQPRMCLAPVTSGNPRHLDSVERAIAAFREECAVRAPPGRPITGLDGVLANSPGYETTFHPSWNWETGRRYLTRAGFRVRSKAEKIIADFLKVEGFKFLYEPLLQVDGQYLRPDFYLTDLQLPYEHFGLDTPDYLRRAERKIARYVMAGKPFVYTTFNDETDLEDILTDKLAAADEAG